MSCGGVGWGDLVMEGWLVVKRGAALELSERDIGEAKRPQVPARSRELRATKVDVGKAGTAAAGVVLKSASTSPMVRNRTLGYPRVREGKGNTP